MKFIKSLARNIVSIILLWVFAIALGALLTFGILDVLSWILFLVVMILPPLLWIAGKIQNAWQNHKRSKGA